MPSTVVELDNYSVLMIWTAIAIYAAAFLVYVFDLARRAQVSADAQLARTKQREAVLVGAGGDALADAGSEDAGSAAPGSTAEAKPAVNRLARVATALTTLAVLFHIAGVVLRGIAAERVPWSNMYEFAMTGTVLITIVYLLVNIKYDLKFLGTFITGLVVVLLGGSAVAFYVTVAPLADPLRSVWLVIHVFVATLATAFLALACSLSILQLMQSRRETKKLNPDATLKKSFLDTLPSAENLEGLAYRFSIIGFILWTFTLIAGSIWANDAWGRYWGFDTKEVWTFVIWVLYAGYIHARATRGWRGNRSAWLSIVGFSAVLFNFTIVNIFFKGLHAYSGLTTAG